MESVLSERDIFSPGFLSSGLNLNNPSGSPCTEGIKFAVRVLSDTTDPPTVPRESAS